MKRVSRRHGKLNNSSYCSSHLNKLTHHEEEKALKVNEMNETQTGADKYKISSYSLCQVILSILNF